MMYIVSVLEGRDQIFAAAVDMLPMRLPETAFAKPSMSCRGAATLSAQPTSTRWILLPSSRFDTKYRRMDSTSGSSGI